MRRIAVTSCVVGLGLAVGCGQSPKDEPSVPGPEPVVVKMVPTPVVPAVPVKAQTPPPAPPPPPFEFPSDSGGKKVAAVLTAPPLPSPVAVVSVAPKPRTSAIDRGEFPLPKVTASVPRAPLPASKLPRLSPPPEAIPADLGQGAAENPAAVKLLEKPPVKAAGPTNPSTADLPPLSRSILDRAALDDSTAEISALRTVLTPWPAPFLTVWFLRFTIPDPFEFAEQLKGKTGTDQELGTAPATVTPGKM